MTQESRSFSDDFARRFTKRAERDETRSGTRGFREELYVRSPKIWHFPRSGVEVLVSADGSSSIVEKGKESKSKALKFEASEACLEGAGLIITG